MEYRVICSLCKGHEVTVLYGEKCCLVAIRPNCKNVLAGILLILHSIVTLCASFTEIGAEKRFLSCNIYDREMSSY
jgi:hypothetical protein